MSIEVKINFKDSGELAQFALWWDSRNDKGGPIPYQLAEQVRETVQFDEEPKAEEKPKATKKTTKKAKPEPKPEPTPEGNAITREEFEKAVKAWFAEDGQVRGPQVRQTLDAMGVKGLTDVPEDQFSAVLTSLGLA